jgi:hypothetical protein
MSYLYIPIYPFGYVTKFLLYQTIVIVGIVGNMRLKRPDFNLRQNKNSDAAAITNRIEN